MICALGCLTIRDAWAGRRRPDCAVCLPAGRGGGLPSWKPRITGGSRVRMMVIHGLWAYGAEYLWAEDSTLPATAPPRPGRPSRAPRPHPFAQSASGLARALAELPEPAAGLAGQAVDDELTLWLPSDAAGPFASP